MLPGPAICMKNRCIAAGLKQRRKHRFAGVRLAVKRNRRRRRPREGKEKSRKKKAPRKRPRKRRPKEKGEKESGKKEKKGNAEDRSGAPGSSGALLFSQLSRHKIIDLCRPRLRIYPMRSGNEGKTNTAARRKGDPSLQTDRGPRPDPCGPFGRQRQLDPADY